MSVRIRPATPGDAATIAAFNQRIAEQTEGKTLDSAIVSPGVERLLDDPLLGRYWVAEVNGEVVGQIMVTFEWSDWRNGLIWWIQSVYVVSRFRRQGIFSALYHHVEDLARHEPDVAGLRLYVEKDNERAQTTYRALGMLDPGYRIMETMFED